MDYRSRWERVLDRDERWERGALDVDANVLAACAEAVRRTAEPAAQVQRARTLWRILAQYEDAPAVTVRIARALCEVRGCYALVEARPVLRALVPYLRAQGEVVS